MDLPNHRLPWDGSSAEISHVQCFAGTRGQPAQPSTCEGTGEHHPCTHSQAGSMSKPKPYLRHLYIDGTLQAQVPAL
jgi:hypothetical protein